VEDEGSVAVPVRRHVCVLEGVVGVRGRDAAEGANRPLELRRRHHPRELEQLRLGFRVGDAGQRPNLRVRQLSGCERRVHERDLLEPPRDAEVLARRARLERASPGDPLGARAATAEVPPAVSPVELGDELEPPTRSGVQVRGEGEDFVLQLA